VLIKLPNTSLVSSRRHYMAVRSLLPCS